jgi:hypothetical protein
MTKIILMLLTVAAGFLLHQRAVAQFMVTNSVFGNGGAMVSDSSYHLVGTVGQPVISEAQNSSHSNHVGFWYLRRHPVIAGDEQTPISVPMEYRLEQNYPNPFNPETEIRFQLPQAGLVVIKIFNILGEEIRTLADAQYDAGYHRVRWDGKDKNGKSVASGVYLYQLRAGRFSQVKKMSFIR